MQVQGRTGNCIPIVRKPMNTASVMGNNFRKTLTAGGVGIAGTGMEETWS